MFEHKHPYKNTTCVLNAIRFMKKLGSKAIFSSIKQKTEDTVIKSQLTRLSSARKYTQKRRNFFRNKYKEVSCADFFVLEC